MQALNNFATDQWNDGQVIFSFTFSVLVVFNSIYRFVYYPYVLGASASTVPMSVSVPNPRLFFGESWTVTFEITEPESRKEKEKHLYEIADDATGLAELHRRVEKAYKEIGEYANLCLLRNDFVSHMVVMELLLAHKITSPAVLAKHPTTVKLLHDVIGKSGRNLRFLARCPNLEEQLLRFTTEYDIASVSMVDQAQGASVFTFFRKFL
jgi:hypothetical protein